MEITRSSLLGVPLLKVVGDIDHFSSLALDDAFQDALSSGATHILLDLTECPYLDSGGLGVILTVLRKVRAKGWLGCFGCSPDLLWAWRRHLWHSKEGLFGLTREERAASRSLSLEFQSPQQRDDTSRPDCGFPSRRGIGQLRPPGLDVGFRHGLEFLFSYAAVRAFPVVG